MFKKPSANQVISLSVLLILFFTLIFISRDFLFDEERVICPHRKIFDVECPFCGMTRASYYLVHFDFSLAFFSNAAVFPMLVYIVLGIISMWTQKPIIIKLQKLFLIILILFFIVIYAYRIYAFLI